MSKPERPKRRMLLIASVGVATVSYALAGCGKSQPPGNLAAPPQPTATTPVAGNLVAMPPPDASQPTPEVTPPATASAPPSASPSTSTKPPLPPVPPHAGNLMAPPPKK